MNKTNLILIVGLVVIIILAIYNWSIADRNDALMPIDRLTTETSLTPEIEPALVSSQGLYEVYSPEKLALAETGQVILFFRASWCPTCRGLDNDIRSNLGSIPSGVAILDVDYDNSTALKQKYGITYQHTLVQVDAAGNQIAKWTGSPTLNSLISNIK